MLPISLRMVNFGPYVDVTVSFTGLYRVSLMGDNAAGKSTLIDAPLFATWGESSLGALDDHIRRGASEGRVEYEFEHRSETYRIIRHRSREKKKTLLDLSRLDEGEWVPIGGKGVDDTQALINELVGLNYDMFTATVVSLQSKSDALTADMKDADRKELLSSVLGLGMWDKLASLVKLKLSGDRKAGQQGLYAQVDDINRQIETALSVASHAVEIQTIIQIAEQTVSRSGEVVAEHGRIISDLEAQLAQRPILEQQKADFDGRVIALRSESGMKGSEATAYEKDIRQAEVVITRPADVEAQIPGAEQEVAQAAGEVEKHIAEVADLEGKLQQAEAVEQQIADIDRQVAAAQERQRQITADGQRVKSDLDQLNQIIDRAGAIRGAAQLSEQYRVKLDSWDIEAKVFRTLEEAIRRYEAEETAWQRETGTKLATLRVQVQGYRRETTALEGLPCAEDIRPACPLLRGALSSAELLDAAEVTLAELEQATSPNAEQLSALRQQLSIMNYSPDEHDEVRRSLGGVTGDAALLPTLETAEKRLPDVIAQREELKQRYRQTEKELSELQAKRISPGTYESPVALRTMISHTKDTLNTRQVLERQRRSDLAKLQQSLEEAIAQAEQARGRIPELQEKVDAAKRRQVEIEAEIAALKAKIAAIDQGLADADLIGEQKESALVALGRARTEEAKHREELGSLRQRLTEAEKAAEQVKALGEQLAKAERQVLVYETLERACGQKAGVPALIIENAVPLIEASANDMLERMAGGRLSLRLDTQLEGKTTPGGQEVLRITVLNEGEAAPYHTCSGAEKFMVDMALRYGLSNLLGERDLFVIDEGFGSLTAANRMVVLNAINEMAKRFRLVIVVSHIVEIQDSMPQRIEVTRGNNGSSVQTVA